MVKVEMPGRVSDSLSGQQEVSGQRAVDRWSARPLRRSMYVHRFTVTALRALIDLRASAVNTACWRPLGTLLHRIIQYRRTSTVEQRQTKTLTASQAHVRLADDVANKADRQAPQRTDNDDDDDDAGGMDTHDRFMLL